MRPILVSVCNDSFCTVPCDGSCGEQIEFLHQTIASGGSVEHTSIQQGSSLCPAQNVKCSTSSHH